MAKGVVKTSSVQEMVQVEVHYIPTPGFFLADGQRRGGGAAFLICGQDADP
jgi:hypothetical protein